MNQTLWAPVYGYEGYYSISSLGQVRSDRSGRGTYSGRILKQRTTPKGYKTVWLCKYGLGRSYRVSRLVALSFLGIPDNPLEVNHKNGDKGDNRLCNLEWVSHLRNIHHAGENSLNGMRLSEDDVRHILTDSTSTGRALAETYGVSESTISLIRKRKIWKHADLGVPKEGE